MVTYPTLYTSFFDSEFAVEAPISEEVVRKMIQNCNMLSRLAVVGQVAMVQPNIPGSIIPSAEQFRFCDGSVLSNGDSALDGQTIPDMRDKYVRAASTTTTNDDVGNATINLTHDHGGVTGDLTHPLGPDAGASYNTAWVTHNHTIPQDLTSPITLNLKYMYFAFYLKIT